MSAVASQSVPLIEISRLPLMRFRLCSRHADPQVNFGVCAQASVENVQQATKRRGKEVA